MSTQYRILFNQERETWPWGRQSAHKRRKKRVDWAVPIRSIHRLRRVSSREMNELVDSTDEDEEYDDDDDYGYGDDGGYERDAEDQGYETDDENFHYYDR